jgi:hypothetical protein
METKDNYPFPLISKEEREKMHGNRDKYEMHEGRGSNGHMGSMRRSMSVTMPSVFPSIPKGDIVERLVFIDVNP